MISLTDAKSYNTTISVLQAAAMFKVLKDTPPIPETLSPEGKDFLRWCFCRNPAERPSASMLLEHRFMRISHQPDVPSFLKPAGGVRIKVSTFNSSPLLSSPALLPPFLFYGV